MAALTTMALATAAVGAGPASSIMSIREQRRASDEQRRAARVERRRAALENARARRQAVAQSMIQQSQVEAVAAGMGGTTSGTQVTTGAIQSQTAGALGFQRGQEGLYSSIMQAQNSANQRMSRANTYQAIGNFTNQLGVPNIGSLTRMIGRQ
jgi:hypothetical protein